MSILRVLIEHRDRVVTKEELLDRVWGDRFVSESALTTQIKAIRRAVGDSGRAQSVVKTVHGQGYMFVAPVDDDAVRQPEIDVHPAPVNDGDRPVLAVLPFTNQTADPGRGHVADGLTADVIAGLSRHRWLRVLTRATAAAFASQPDAMARLRDELGASYVIDGSVRLDGSRLRVSVSLTATESGVCRWAERFDRDAVELFDVLDEITDVIVATIEPEIGYAERERVGRRPRTDLRAWDLFHLGIAHFFRFTAEDNLDAQRLLDEARCIDADFGEAHAWWAYAVVLGMTYWDTDPEPEVLDEALSATQAALATDEHNAVFHMLRGRVQLARREYGAALLENQRAIELNPTFAAAFCGLGDSLCYEGRYDEAIDQFTRSVALGSHDPQRWAFLSYGALALVFAGRYDEAVDWAARAETIPNCQYWTTAHRVVALALSDRREECERAVAKLLHVAPFFTVEYARRKLFYLRRPEQLDRYLGGLEAAGVPTG